MKKIITLLLSISFVLCSTACNNSTTNSIFCPDCDEQILADDKFCRFCGARTDEETNSEISQDKEDKVDNAKKPFVQLNELKNIVDYSFVYDLFITTDGSLYKIGNFSDGTNLRKIGDGIKFVKFHGISIISENNDCYWYNEDDFSVELHDNTQRYDYINSAIGIIGGNVSIKVYIKENEIFLSEESESFYHTILQKGPIHKFDDNETILYFIDGNIKTNKGYYCFKQTINDSPYDDIPTTYTYSFEKITDVNEDVIFFKRDYNQTFREPDITVDKNGNLFRS